jgi:Uma2 family endonuclease
MTILTQAPPKRRRKVPEALLYEIMDGEPIYYKGYREVMSGKKTLEEIMGASTLQFYILNYLVRLFSITFDEDLFIIATGEAGVHIDHRNNLANDLALYEDAALTPDKINKHYADIPPLLAIEIDIKADLDNPRDYAYVQRKTKKLLDFGTEKVIWIFTETQKIMVATVDDDWRIIDWYKDIALTDLQTFNIGKYLDKKGIKPE